jgi:hypothetical protein
VGVTPSSASIWFLQTIHAGKGVDIPTFTVAARPRIRSAHS